MNAHWEYTTVQLVCCVKITLEAILVCAPADLYKMQPMAFAMVSVFLGLRLQVEQYDEQRTLPICR